MPNRDTIHVDTLLSNLSIKYRPAGMIAMEVFPEVGVKKNSDLFRVYDRDFRIPETKRANRGEAREHDFNVSTSSYTLVRHSLKGFVSDTDQENYDLADLRQEMTEELTEKILMRMELDVAQLFTTTNWSLNVSLAANATFVDNTTASNPIPIYDTGASTVIAESGKKPNFSILPRTAYIGVKNHVSVLDRLKYTTAEIDENKIASLLGVEKLLVPMVSYDTSNKGVASSLTPFYDDVAFLGFRADSPGPLKVSAGFTFRNKLPLVKRWRVEERESECIEVNMEYAAKVVASLCGYLIKNAY